MQIVYIYTTKFHCYVLRGYLKTLDSKMKGRSTNKPESKTTLEAEKYMNRDTR